MPAPVTPELDRSWRSRPMLGLANILSDSLYRNSLFMISNSVLAAGLGLVFWTLAARLFSSAAVGDVTALLGVVTLAGTAATMGLPNTLIRFIASAPDERELVGISTTVATLAAVVVAVAW